MTSALPNYDYDYLQSLLSDLYPDSFTDEDILDNTDIYLIMNDTSYNFSWNESTNYTMSAAEGFYAFVTPIIIVIGLAGNLLSLAVFLTKAMRNQPASLYLVALSISDTTVLITYVLIDWINDGLPVLLDHDYMRPIVSALGDDGPCHVHLYFSYFSRFLSVWLIVTFTCERYIGVCHPFKRIQLCTTSWSRRVVGGLVVISLLVAVYKPVMSGGLLTESNTSNYTRCASKPEHKYASLVLDTIYGLCITLIPFVIIFALNSLMARELCLRKQQQQMRGKMERLEHESKIKLEFTFILVALSISFIVLNLPYFVEWCIVSRTHFMMLDNFLLTPPTPLLVTKPIFFLNYCINFFLYSMTGAFFRRELKSLCYSKNTQKKILNRKLTWSHSYSSNLINHTHQTWV